MSKINNLSEKEEKNNIRKNIRHRHKINNYKSKNNYMMITYSLFLFNQINEFI